MLFLKTYLAGFYNLVEYLLETWFVKGDFSLS